MVIRFAPVVVGLTQQVLTMTWDDGVGPPLTTIRSVVGTGQ